MACGRVACCLLRAACCSALGVAGNRDSPPNQTLRWPCCLCAASAQVKGRIKPAQRYSAGKSSLVAHHMSKVDDASGMATSRGLRTLLTVRNPVKGPHTRRVLRPK